MGVLFISLPNNTCGMSITRAILVDMATNLITAKEKADQLGISRTHLSRLVKAGEITPAFKANGTNGVMLFETDTTEQVAS